MFSSINKRLGFPIFKGRTDKVSNGDTLSSLHIPESACNMGVVVGVGYVAALILSSFLSAVYWALMAVCFVAALFLLLYWKNPKNKVPSQNYSAFAFW
ncbi:hypothetical protein ANAPC1_01292 [Anaplasma phagocytophilum]|uniref:Uncharacterized protein n=1 Tax=Anaplasma phagocytophilum TaxID=948 RepID=A0AA45UUA0_ANAPH|nr:hypothetical protein [Anaplasma phagocytophilum]SBO14916.1 hypothetical protein ANAPC1_01292 [Anaplasma phagocytophilum]